MFKYNIIFAVGSSVKNIKRMPNGAGVASFHSIKICDGESDIRKWDKEGK